MMSSTAEEVDFPPSNPFRSADDQQQPMQQQPPQQQQQLPPPQQQAQQMNDFYGEPPQPVATNGGQWMQPQPDAFVSEQQPFQQSVGSGPMDTNMTDTAPAPAAPAPPQSRWQRLVWCCSLNTYKAYFDVDTIDITTRVKASLQTFYVPDKFRTEIIGVERNDTLKGPDLYGPFWITMTLVFLLAVTSNLHAYLHSTTDENFEYDISHLIRAMTVLALFCFALPALLWLMTQCMGMNAMGMFDWICLYGYSMVIYLPASILCLIPSEVVEWLVLVIATIVSGSLVLRNVAAPLLSADVSQTKAAPIMMCVLGFHVVFLLVLKFGFYYHHKKIVP